MLTEVVQTGPCLLALGAVGRRASIAFICATSGCYLVNGLSMSFQIVVGTEVLGTIWGYTLMRSGMRRHMFSSRAALVGSRPKGNDVTYFCSD
jgi:hypothetical protein